MLNETDVITRVPHLSDLLAAVEADLAQPAPQPASASAPDAEPAAEGGPVTIMDALAQIGAAPAGEPDAGLPTRPAAPPPGSPEGERQRAAALTEIADQGARLGVAVDVSAAIERGTEPEALRREILAQAAARACATMISTATPAETAFRAGPPVERQSPIVEMARRQRERFERGGR